MDVGRTLLALAALLGVGLAAWLAAPDDGPRNHGAAPDRAGEPPGDGPLLQGRLAAPSPDPEAPAAPDGAQVGEAPRDEHRAPRKVDDVLLNLRWLAAHQSPDGSWDPARAGTWCDGTPQPASTGADGGLEDHQVGATSLALLAFLAAGYTFRGATEFATTVRKGMNWLKRDAQNADGLLLTSSHDGWLWDHILGTLALLEAYGMTESVVVRDPALRALEALLERRDPTRGTWSSDARLGGVEEALTLWAALPLRTARLIHDDQVKRGKPTTVPSCEPELEGIRRWIEARSDPTTGAFRLGGPYEERGLPGSSSASLRALSMLVRVIACEDPRAEGPLRRGLATLASDATPWDPRARDADPIRIWATAHALFGGTGPAWARWEEDVLASVVAAQHTEGDACEVRGSWDPAGELGRTTGRVGSTAVMGLAFPRGYDRGIGCNTRWDAARAR